MQVGNEQLEAQQRIMQAKNLYNGKIDGIWGPKTIAAKQKWERGGKFAPATPNNGFPLNDRGPLPVGVRRLPSGILTCVELDNEALKSKQAAPVQQVSPPQHNQQKNKTIITVQPKVEQDIPVVKEAESESF